MDKKMRDKAHNSITTELTGAKVIRYTIKKFIFRFRGQMGEKSHESWSGLLKLGPHDVWYLFKVRHV